MGRTDQLAWPISGAAGACWQVRPFARSLADLELDLDQPAPAATTALLGACLGDADGPVSVDQAWAWTLNRRLQGLLAITVATRGAYWVHTVRCRNPDCDEPMDLPMQLSDFQRDDDPRELDCPVPGAPDLQVRLPTGTDQRAWLAEGLGAGDPDRLLARLLVAAPGLWARIATADARESIEDALAEADPLMALELETSCPACGAQTLIPLDLEQTCLNLLAAEQPRLQQEVHRLALAYHWSEAEILAIAPARRRRYLALLDADESGTPFGGLA